MTLKEGMRVCPHLSEDQAKAVLETARKEVNPVTYGDIGRAADELY
jgi:hypothetical protein